MQRYDEDLYMNPLFVTLQKDFTSLFEDATARRLVIIVPKRSSLENITISRTDCENHICSSVYDNPTLFRTVGNKELTIKGSVITTGQGFESYRTVAILFEETFFNKKDESYRVLCVNRPLEGKDKCDDLSQSLNDERNNEDEDEFIDVEPNCSLFAYSIDSCGELLWGHTGNLKTKDELQILVDRFNRNLEKPMNSTRITLKILNEEVTRLFNRSVGLVLKDSVLSKNVKSSSETRDNIYLAVETYIMHNIYQRLFRHISTLVAQQDARLNKITRNWGMHLDVQDLGIKQHFSASISRARKEICNLGRYMSAFGKLNCLLRVATSLTSGNNTSAFPAAGISTAENSDGSTTPPGDYNESTVLTCDDLLAIFIFLIVKTETTNWWAQFTLMKYFHFSVSPQDQQFQYYLSNFEASLTHITDGRLSNMLSSTNTNINKLTMTPYNQLIVDTSCEHWELFQKLVENDEEAVKRLLYPTNTRDSSVPEITSGFGDAVSSLCHPLCCCSKCQKLVSQSQNVSDRSIFNMVNARNYSGFTPLHIAALHGNIGIVDLLISNGARVDEKSLTGLTPLHIGAQRGHQSIVMLLLDHKACINSADRNLFTPLHWAALNGHEECVNSLLYFLDENCESVIDRNAANAFGDTALHLAAKWGYVRIVDALIQHGALTTVVNRKNQLPLQCASNLTISSMLQSAMCEEKERPTMLHLRASLTMTRQKKQPVLDQHSNLRRHSIDTNGSLNTNNAISTVDQGSSNLPIPAPCCPPTRSQSSYAVKTSSHDNIMRRSTIATHADVFSRLPRLDSTNITQRVPNSDHVRGLRKVKPSSKAEVNKNVSCEVDQTAADNLVDNPALHERVYNLLMSVAEGDVNAVKSQLGWLDMEAEHPEIKNIDVSKSMLCHPLCYCEKCFLIQQLTIIPSSGLHVNSRSADGFTPLHEAARKGHVELVQLFIKRGASVDVCTERKRSTPLHLACRQPTVGVVKLLVESGCQINVRDASGNMPLHYCCMYGYEHLVDYLIKSGAQLDAVNTAGETCLHSAVKRSQLPIVQLLIKFGADVFMKTNQLQSTIDFAQTEEVKQCISIAVNQHTSFSNTVISADSNLIDPDITRTSLVLCGNISMACSDKSLDSTNCTHDQFEAISSCLTVESSDSKVSCIQTCDQSQELSQFGPVIQEGLYTTAKCEHQILTSSCNGNECSNSRETYDAPVIDIKSNCLNGNSHTDYVHCTAKSCAELAVNQSLDSSHFHKSQMDIPQSDSSILNVDTLCFERVPLDTSHLDNSQIESSHLNSQQVKVEELST